MNGKRWMWWGLAAGEMIILLAALAYASVPGGDGRAWVWWKAVACSDARGQYVWRIGGWMCLLEYPDALKPCSRKADCFGRCLTRYQDLSNVCEPDNMPGRCGEFGCP